MSDTSNTTSPADPSDRLAPAPVASRVLACYLAPPPAPGDPREGFGQRPDPSRA